MFRIGTAPAETRAGALGDLFEEPWFRWPSGIEDTVVRGQDLDASPIGWAAAPGGPGPLVAR